MYYTVQYYNNSTTTKIQDFDLGANSVFYLICGCYDFVVAVNDVH